MQRASVWSGCSLAAVNCSLLWFSCFGWLVFHLIGLGWWKEVWVTVLRYFQYTIEKNILTWYKKRKRKRKLILKLDALKYMNYIYTKRTITRYYILYCLIYTYKVIHRQCTIILNRIIYRLDGNWRKVERRENEEENINPTAYSLIWVRENREEIK